MALLLRVISRAKWATTPAWMKAGDAPADILSDLRAENNQLSVWSVEPDRSNLDSVVVAIASSRLRLDKLDYALFDEHVLPPLAIRCVRSEGRTPHPRANGAMHRDLTELTVQKVASLAHALMPAERVRIPEGRIRLMLVGAIQSDAIERGRIDPDLLTALEGAKLSGTPTDTAIAARAPSVPPRVNVSLGPSASAEDQPRSSTPPWQSKIRHVAGLLSRWGPFRRSK
jgi:hypothetical protein